MPRYYSADSYVSDWHQKSDSAYKTFTKPQLLTLNLLLAGFVLGAVLLGVMTFFMIVAGAFTILYLVMLVFKTVVTGESLRSGMTTFEPEEITSLVEAELPEITILVPLFREGEKKYIRRWPLWLRYLPFLRRSGFLYRFSWFVVHDGEEKVIQPLVHHLQALDYPEERKTVLFLIEEADTATWEAVDRQTQLAGLSNCTLVRVPFSHPQTKPKACNIGLMLATGEYVVIYDAEDRPEPDQLKKAVWAFREAARDVVCVQARLEYHNPFTNPLTRLFAAEYATYFNLVLPGLSKFNLPVPLGGTSNFFKTRVLKELGGWDPYCVTEDLMLGMQIARNRLRVEVMDSVTWEEANSKLGNWLRQRSRWIKGHIQVYFVMMRDPRALYRDLGLVGFAGFQMIVGSVPLVLIVNPTFWVLTLLYFAFELSLIQQLYPTPILYVGVIAMTVGNLAFLFYVHVGCMRRDLHSITKWALVGSLFYWALMSLAAWKALFQIITKPHFWEKTDHGLA